MMTAARSLCAPVRRDRWHVLSVLLAGVLAAQGVFASKAWADQPTLERGGDVRSTLAAAPGTSGIGHRDVVRRYRFEVEEAGERWVFGLESDDFDAYLYLLSPGDEVIAFDDDGGEGLDSRLFHVFDAPGTFLLGVTSFGGASEGRYRLRAQSLGLAGDVEDARPLPRGGEVADLLVIQQSGPRVDHRAVTRHHPFEARAGETWEFYLGSDAFDAYLHLLGPDGRILATDDDGGQGLDSRIVWTAAVDGTYTLVVTSFGGSAEGPYSLRASLFEPREAEWEEVRLGERMTADLDRGAGRNVGGNLYRGFTFTVDEPGWVVLTLDDVDWTVSTRIAGPHLQEVLPEQGWFEPGENLVALLWPGTYRLVFESSAGASRPWSFRLAAQDDTPRREARPVPGDGRAEGTLRPGARRAGDRWTIDARAGQLLSVDLRSGAFDAYLMIEDPLGAIVAENDDGGGHLDSRIVLRIPRSGTYTLVATSFASTEQGPYTLSVRLSDPGRIRATRLRPGRWVSGDLRRPTYHDDSYFSSPSDLYRMRARAGQRLRVEVDGESVGFEVQGPTGTTLHSDWGHVGHMDHDHHDWSWMEGAPAYGEAPLLHAGQAEGGAAASDWNLVDLPHDGEYRIHVRARGEAGPYRVRATLLEPERDDIGRIVLGEVLEGAFTDRSPLEPSVGFRRLYLLEVDNPGRLTLTAEADDAPVFIEMERIGGTRVMNTSGSEDMWMYGQSDLAEPYTYSALVLPGRYVVAVRQAGMRRTGWRLASSLQPLVVGEPRTLRPGGGAGESLIEGDLDAAVLDAPGRLTPGVPYRLALAENERVRVTLRSADFDAYLVAVSMTGEVIAFDDDSGGGLDAQLMLGGERSFDVVLYATSFDGATRGAYTLQVERVGP